MSTFVNQPASSVRPNGPARKPRANGEPSYEELKARYDALLAKAQARNVLTVKIMDVKADGSEGKGGIAVFGLQRFPFTLFAEQWERLLAGITAPEGTVAHAILQACKDPRATRKNG